MVLCYASEYFDAMLSSNMKEGNTKTVEFREKDPDEWRKVCRFFEPTAITVIKEADLSIIVPWFSELRMTRLLKYCDKVMRQKLRNESRLLDKNAQHNRGVKRVKATLERTDFCILYDLVDSVAECRDILKFILEERSRLIQHEESAAQIVAIMKNNEAFQRYLLPSVRKLVPSITPEMKAEEILNSPHLPRMIIDAALSKP